MGYCSQGLGRTPLLLAIERTTTECIDALLALGACPDTPSVT
jgi:hypothetical protein